MIDAAVARRNMVDSQIRPNRVTDLRVIAAFDSVPRERFVPPALAGVAYLDEDLEIAPGRFLIEPMVLARLIQALDPGPSDRALDIGTGYGYAAAVLAQLAGSVVTVESDAGLADAARRAIGATGGTNVALERGPLAAGHPDAAPYDLILLGGSVERVPTALLDQLGEGGRLATVLLERGVGQASLFLKSGGVVSHRVLFDAATPPLPGFAAAPRFVF